MKIGTYEAPREIVEKAVTLMWEQGLKGFTLRDVECLLRLEGVPRGCQNRMADRLLQKHKRRGEITYDQGKWCWVADKPSWIDG